MPRVTIDLNAAELQEHLAKIKAKTGNLSGLMKRFAATALVSINERFQREGPGWPKHAPSTELRRGRNAPILKDKGDLLKSMTGRQGGYSKIGSDYVEFGSNLKYAAIHNFGGTIIQKGRHKVRQDLRARKSKKLQKAGKSTGSGLRTITIKARRFLPLQEELTPFLIAEAEDYFKKLDD